MGPKWPLSELVAQVTWPQNGYEMGSEGWDKWPQNGLHKPRKGHFEAISRPFWGHFEAISRRFSRPFSRPNPARKRWNPRRVLARNEAVSWPWFSFKMFPQCRWRTKQCVFGGRNTFLRGGLLRTRLLASCVLTGVSEGLAGQTPGDAREDEASSTHPELHFQPRMCWRLQHCRAWERCHRHSFCFATARGLWRD